MNEFSEQFHNLKKVVSDYDEFCRIAVEIDWFELTEEHYDWDKIYPQGICIDYFEFPEKYFINHPSEAYERIVLSSMGFYEGWEINFWALGTDERICCLTNAKSLYCAYAILHDIRFKETNPNFLKDEIYYYAECNGIETALAEKCAKYIENASIIELGGSYDADHTYLAVKGNTLIKIDCGVWD